jgi:hypothetical protein
MEFVDSTQNYHEIIGTPNQIRMKVFPKKEYATRRNSPRKPQ